MRINEQIKKLRKRDGMTQDDLAANELLCCNRQKIADWERGKSTPSADDIIALSKIFNVSTDYLLGLTDVSTTDKGIQFICDYTGLSERAVQLLGAPIFQWSNSYIRILSGLIENDSCIHLLDSIDRYHLHLAQKNGELFESYKNLNQIYEKYSTGEITEEELEDQYEEWDYSSRIDNLANGDLFEMQEIIKNFAQSYYHLTFDESNELRKKTDDIKTKIVDIIIEEERKYFRDHPDQEEQAGDDNGDNQTAQ